MAKLIITATYLIALTLGIANANYGPQAVNNYGYRYSVNDYYGNEHSAEQNRVGNAVKGQYKVLLPDGRLQTVTYVADEGGYRAKVDYTPASPGEATTAGLHTAGSAPGPIYAGAYGGSGYGGYGSGAAYGSQYAGLGATGAYFGSGSLYNQYQGGAYGFAGGSNYNGGYGYGLSGGFNKFYGSGIGGYGYNKAYGSGFGGYGYGATAGHIGGYGYGAAAGLAGGYGGYGFGSAAQYGYGASVGAYGYGAPSANYGYGAAGVIGHQYSSPLFNSYEYQTPFSSVSSYSNTAPVY